MGCCKRFLFVSSLLTAIFLGYFYHKLTRVPDLPKFELDKWWGPGKPQRIDTSIRPFKIEFSDELVDDLKNRLSRVSLTPPLEGVGFQYGFNSNYLKDVLQFWINDYNFTERETFLNKYSQFKTNIQGLDIHYIHIKPAVVKNIKVVPLLMIHGWPGSVKEYFEVIPILSTPRRDHNFVFELIVPSIPGYGFSQPAAKPGLGSDEVAIIMRNLMHRLGHTKYYVQGGDWGAYVTHIMAIYFPEEVLGLHSNMAFIATEWGALKWVLGSIYPPLVIDNDYRDWMYPLGEKAMRLLEETGYLHLQATKPDTVGTALRDSPAGLAAYMLEKYSTWTNPEFRKLHDGGLTKKYALVDLLDNVMIFWTSGCITSSMRLYSETFNKRSIDLQMGRRPVLVPSAIANYKNDMMVQPESIQRDKYVNLVQIHNFQDGGHFAAFELPQLVADDIWLAVSEIRRLAAEQGKKL